MNGCKLTNDCSDLLRAFRLADALGVGIWVLGPTTRQALPCRSYRRTEPSNPGSQDQHQSSGPVWWRQLQVHTCLPVNTK